MRFHLRQVSQMSDLSICIEGSKKAQVKEIAVAQQVKMVIHFLPLRWDLQVHKSRAYFFILKSGSSRTGFLLCRLLPFLFLCGFLICWNNLLILPETTTVLSFGHLHPQLLLSSFFFYFFKLRPSHLYHLYLFPPAPSSMNCALCPYLFFCLLRVFSCLLIFRS